MPKSSHVTLQYSFNSDIDFSSNDTISSLLRRDRWQILQSELIRGEQPCWQRFEKFHACKQFEDRANGRRQTASLQSRRAYTRVRRCQSARNRIRGATLLSQLGRQLISNREREGGRIVSHRGRRNLVRRTIDRLQSHRFLPVTCNQSLFATTVNCPPSSLSNAR